MKHMSHPDEPDVVAEADEDRAAILASAGWAEVKPSRPKK